MERELGQGSEELQESGSNKQCQIQQRGSVR